MSRTGAAQVTRPVMAARVRDIGNVHVGDFAPVSVVVPCFRCTDTIGQAVASIAAQMILPAEVLLVDDGSGDGTLERLRQLAREYPPGWIKIIALPRNSGPSTARNRGWEHARQPWIAFLDADDSWHPQKLKLQLEAIAEDPKIAFIAHEMNVQARSAPTPALHYPVRRRVFPRRLPLFRSPFPTASIMLRRDLPFRFDEKRWRAEDFMLWAQILLSGYRCVKLNQVLASYHKPPFGAGGLSGNMAAMYEASVDVRRTLHEQGLLSWWQLYLTDAIALIRYVRRCVLAYVRRRRGSLLPEATPNARRPS